MSSGMRKLQINTQERAISTDVNRLQDFKARDVAEFARYLLDVSSNDDLEAGARATEHSSVESPLRAEVAGGLMVQPQIGNPDLVVTAGMLYALAPDAGADDSNYKYVRHSGVIAGTLAIGANSSGSTRIDVVECEVAYLDAASESRDVFNEVTGLFSPATVVKEKVGTLNFRVRAGTPGGGFPGTASGWLPLCVASVPTGTTTNDTVTFWDVRPMINDRAFGLGNVVNSAQGGRLCANVSGLGYTMTGFAEVVHDGRRLGGKLRRGSPGADAESVDFSAAANQESGFVDAATQTFFYLLTPFGLPRWARYTDFGSGSRLPRSPRGIPVVSKTQPTVDGTPGSAIALPAATGLSASTSSGKMFTMVATSVATASGSRAIRSDNNRVSFGQAIGPAGFAQGGATISSILFLLTPSTHFPANAKRFRVRLAFTININQTGVHTTGPGQLTHFISGDTSAFIPKDELNFQWLQPGNTTADPTEVNYGALVSLTATRILDLPVLGGTPEYAVAPQQRIQCDTGFSRTGGGSQPTIGTCTYDILDLWF